MTQYTHQQYLDAVIATNGSRTAAAKLLDINIRTLQRGLKICKKRGMKVPDSPHIASRDVHPLEQVEPSHDDSAPDGFNVKGVSTLRDAEGNVVAEWIKTVADNDRKLEMLRAAAEELASTVPRAWPATPPQTTNDQLCNVYTITDYHVGMLAWRHEGGADWDLNVAEELLVKAFGYLTMNSPPAKYAVVNQLGDFLHTDGFMPLTPTSKHVLDADSRFPKIVKVAVRVLRTVIDMALQRHEHVHVILAEGNHDLASSVWLRELFKALYENEPRVSIETSPLPYYAHQHGKTMLGFHHGHLRKVARLAGLMAAQFPVIWGNTKYRYCHSGHLHHSHEKEDEGMLVTQHRTLASRDAYAARGGYHAERDAKCISYHKEYGEVARTVVKPEMVIDAPVKPD